MKRVVLFVFLLVLLGCAVRKIGPVSARIAKVAIRHVSFDRNVSFTRDARYAVIEKTDAYVQPRITELEKDPALETTFTTQTQAALDQHVIMFKIMFPEERKLTARDLKWFAATIQDYGGLILSSVPPGAAVFCSSHGNTYEGDTKMERVYPVDTYTFDLRRDRCKDASIQVKIKKDETIEENVPLDCE